MVQRLAKLTAYLKSQSADLGVDATPTLDLALAVDSLLERVMLKSAELVQAENAEVMLGRHFREAFLAVLLEELDHSLFK